MGDAVSEREWMIKMFRAWSASWDDEAMGVLGYEWIQAAGMTEPASAYARAKATIADMDRQSWMVAMGRAKGRKGRPGQYWMITPEGTEAWAQMEESQKETPHVLEKLRASKKGMIRVKMPCEKEVWKQITALGKSGQISLILRLEGND